MEAGLVRKRERDGVRVALNNDNNRSTQQLVVSPALAALLSRAHTWALAEQAEGQYQPGPTLTFSSMLFAMRSGADPLCGWLRRHLELRGAVRHEMPSDRKFDPAPIRKL